jgi:membrane protein implicated in regulation of membrane protease activity
MTGFIPKVLALSLLISIAIKYGAPVLPIPGTTTTALIAVFSPTILIAIALVWRWQHNQASRRTGDDGMMG